MSETARQKEASNPLDYAMASRDKDVMSLVRNALAAERCKLAFQPVVRSDQRDQVAFYEGLIRVLDEGGRIIPAHQFMGSIEETEIGREIDTASLKAGFQMLRENPHIRLSVNISARSLADGKWRRTLESNLLQDETVGERLIVEINESSAMNLHEVVVRFMDELQPRGVAFALDDFGAGATSFRHLKDFFFDMVKIDRCFARGVEDSPDNQVLAEALMTVAHQFEMFAVSGGIESEAAAQFMMKIGMDCLQGFHIGIPKMTL
ncbi:EAL domain-containing protein [Aestuariibius sp. HNIBRBA575]|uniref:EAL domain-containing protein n=1 Tax=Aestuariibius sp. HNIBRBA575 TaxID=3233343 RepID=UPI0034A5255F